MTGRAVLRWPDSGARRGIVILDFGDRGEGNFYDRAVGAEHFDAGSSQSLSGFHTPNRASDSFAVRRNDLDVVLAIQRL